jgi:hypothetical protein
VQTYKEKGFEKRLYVYNYRIFDRYDKQVITLIILADDDPKYNPQVYEQKLWNFELTFKFPTRKLLNYKDKLQLDKAVNPFEIITYAHLKNLETKKNPKDRLFWKITLVKLLYEKGLKKQDILNLYRFIDWIMGLPEDLTEKFTDEIHKYDEEGKMRFVTSFERVGIKKGKLEGKQEVLLIALPALQKSIAGMLEIKFWLILRFGVLKL